MSRRTVASFALLCTAALTLAGCGEEQEPVSPASSTTSSADSGAESGTDPGAGPGQKAFAVTISGGTASPNGERVSVAAGETFVVAVTSDIVDEMHVHSSPEQSFEIEPGSQNFEITIDRPGVVDVELHESGLTVLQVEVQ